VKNVKAPIRQKIIPIPVVVIQASMTLGEMMVAENVKLSAALVLHLHVVLVMLMLKPAQVIAVSAILVFIIIAPHPLAKNVTKCAQPVPQLVVLLVVMLMLFQAPLTISVLVKKVIIMKANLLPVKNAMPNVLLVLLLRTVLHAILHTF